MALIQTVNASDLYHMACRMDRGDQFGYNGWGAIGEYLENLSEDIGEDIEADIIAICCDYAMCESAQEFWDEQELPTVSDEEWQEMDDEEKLEAISEYLHGNTAVVCVEENCIIWQAF